MDSNSERELWADPPEPYIPARFILRRDRDTTGTSGTGVVAEGVRFSDGTVAMRWLPVDPDSDSWKRGVRPTTALHESIESVIALHGHFGATHVDWLD